MKSNNYICHVPYLRNSMAYDHDFWYACVKWYLQAFFFHSFFKFSFFGLLEGGSGGKRRKYSPKWKITSTSITCHISGTVCDHNVWYTCVKLWYIQAFFHFFDIFIFQAGGGGKRAKNGARWKKNPVWCTSYLRNHISYDCHLLYTCVKWWYPHHFFSFFQNFDSLGC